MRHPLSPRPGSAEGGRHHALSLLAQGALLGALVGGTTVLGTLVIHDAYKEPSSASTTCAMQSPTLRVLSNDLLSPQFRAQHIAESDDAHMTLWGSGYELRLGLRWTHFIANILGMDLVDWEIQAP